MSGDDPIDFTLPVHGTAAGVAYIALPPTAVDAVASGPPHLIVAWPGFDPPRTAGALAAAVPMTGVPAWRVFLDLGQAPGGLGSGAILETETIDAYCDAMERAVDRLPDTVAHLRHDLGVPDGPLGLAGFSAGASAALLAVARGPMPIATAALIAPVIAPSRAARAVETRAARDRAWTDTARARADRLDLSALTDDIAARDTALLLIAGAKDRVVPPGEVTALCDSLRKAGAPAAESVTLRMGHALTPEPGTEPTPPITEAVRVDSVLTDWFRDRLASPPSEDVPPFQFNLPDPPAPAPAPTQNPAPLHPDETLPRATAAHPH
ncbi:prolyl oligopeptidase family serine peptidase [Actinomadura graeca]|uniref:Prolyl oligopeptidase family serine peptidase n=1 Tax=Actinomadura graeca TaxID=2750812 RepID=A0ABX8QWH1_9ACTN|nr:prolyl oligopeptidase family serine peptidase [Actinomadura graeca]QXJ23200.1 prolyl oligopeptidase family serine peptidase [Actinomadura graeca]